VDDDPCLAVLPIGEDVIAYMSTPGGGPSAEPISLTIASIASESASKVATRIQSDISFSFLENTRGNPNRNRRDRA
jgi:hypothetical protein